MFKEAKVLEACDKNRAGASSSVVDKRMSFEIKVMKESLVELRGNLKWMSSDRHIADGLTKESARALFAAGRNTGKLKLTWGPTYKAMKKETKNLRERRRCTKGCTQSQVTLVEVHDGVNRRRVNLIHRGGPPPTNRIISYGKKISAQFLIVMHFC